MPLLRAWRRRQPLSRVGARIKRERTHQRAFLTYNRLSVSSPDSPLSPAYHIDVYHPCSPRPKLQPLAQSSKPQHRPRATTTKMSTLFGAQPAATSSTTGDTSKDVEINSQILPEDSVSDIAFSPAGEHLAVSSWDQKVRIYKITGSNVEPGWMFECEPAAGGAKENPLCVHWSAVCHLFEGQDASK
jgi:hypothetical protein